MRRWLFYLIFEQWYHRNATHDKECFAMTEIIDARGLSCPQPVLLTLSKMRELGTGEFTVLIDNETSRENVTRAARNQGWEISESDNEAQEFRLILKRP
jgi:tRNA 2-thiouridine synthesizing protein A